MVNFIRKLFSPFFVDICISCKTKLLKQEKHICLNCLYNLPRTNNHLKTNNSAEQLLAGKFPFEQAATFCKFNKGGILQPLIHDLKYKQNKEIGIILGRLFGKELMQSGFLETVDLLVPVPLHPQKIKKRGYNQAEIIARGISQSTNIPISTNNLIRIINNPTQTKLSKTQRWENVKGIFGVNNPEKFKNKHIFLIDDIITTGSTLEACAITITEIEGIKISIATLGEAI